MTETKDKRVISCECESCKNACKHKPGWFMPEQIDAILKYFNVISIDELLKLGQIAIDWWVDDNNILLLAPNIKGNEEIYYPGDPTGECIFFNRGKCDIYKIRPYECRQYFHGQSFNITDKRHEKVAQMWKNSRHLKKFKNKVVTSSYGLLGSLFW